MKRTALIGTALLLASPAVAFAAAPQTFDQLATMIVDLLNNATATMVVAGIVIYFFGISSNMIKVGKGETNDMRSYLVWGVAVIFVMVSIWGILRLLQNTLFGNGGYTGGGTSSASQCNSFNGCTFGAP